MTPELAYKRLVEGNKRFVAGLKSVDSMPTHDRRKELAEHGQRPFAMVLCCADSRAPAELIFDAGLGELFVCRVAGNIVAPSLIASLEFAATAFGPQVCVILGHTQCGAVKAGINAAETGQPGPTDHIHDLLREIRPAVYKAKDSNPHAHHDFETLVARENILMSGKNLLDRSRVLRDLVDQGKLGMAGALYDLHTGSVEWLDRPIRADLAPLPPLKTSSSRIVDTVPRRGL